MNRLTDFLLDHVHRVALGIAVAVFLGLLAGALWGCAPKGEKRVRPPEKCYATLYVENNWRWGVDIRVEPAREYVARGLQPLQAQKFCLKERHLHNGVLDLRVRADGYSGTEPWYNVPWECGSPTIYEGMEIRFSVDVHYRFACSWL